MRAVLIKTFFRSFFIQGCWNFNRMQNVGFAFGISPVLLKVFEEGEGRSEALLRSLELFNTHPYMATAILGVAGGMELTGGGGAGGEGKAISEMKETLSGPLAGLGDSFFWATLKPLFSVTAVISGFMASFMTGFVGGLVAPIIFLVLYNSFHLWMRVKGFSVGVRGGSGLIDFLRDLKLPEVTERLTGLIALLTGVLLAGLSFFMPSFLNAGDWGLWGNLMFFALIPVIFLYFLVKKGISLIVVLYVYTLLCMAGFITLGSYVH